MRGGWGVGGADWGQGCGVGEGSRGASASSTVGGLGGVELVPPPWLRPPLSLWQR